MIVLGTTELLDATVGPHPFGLLQRTESVGLLGADVEDRVVLETHGEVRPHATAHGVGAGPDALGLFLADGTHTPGPIA